jgi:hypothetical protein
MPTSFKGETGTQKKRPPGGSRRPSHYGCRGGSTQRLKGTRTTSTMRQASQQQTTSCSDPERYCAAILGRKRPRLGEKRIREFTWSRCFCRRMCLRRGQSCIRQNRIYAAAFNASLLFSCRSRARKLSFVLFDHVKFDPEMARPKIC